MLRVIVSLEGGATVEAPFDKFRLREEVAFERHFGVSSTVLQRFATVGLERREWLEEHPAPSEGATDEERRAWSAAFAEFSDAQRDKAPPQEWMLFMAWQRARKVDPAAIPGNFEAFLDVVTELDYVDPEVEAELAEAAQRSLEPEGAEATGNGHRSVADAGPPPGFDLDEDPTVAGPPSSS